jgi:hypothetical protein
LWQNPTAEYYRSQFEKQRVHDEAQGATVLGMASRSKEARAKMVAGDKPPQGVAQGAVVRPQADASPAPIAAGGRRSGVDERVGAAAKARMSEIRGKLKKVSNTAVTMRVKKGNAALRGGDDGGGGGGAVYTPKMFEELCQYLGIHIIDRDPHKVETHLVHLALEYLDRVHAGELPDGWTAYMDTEGDIPYYYNSRTGENTYDHPLASEMKVHVETSRDEAKNGAEVWSRGSVADYWLLFGGDAITYYNLRTRKTFRSPPHIARQAAETIVRIVRLGSNKDGEGGNDSGAGAVQRSEIVDAFHALDADQSGSVSAEELRPVLMELGGLEESQVNSLIAAADIDGDGEMDYNEFVDTLWMRATSHAQGLGAKSSKVGSRPGEAGHIVDAAGHKISAKSVGAYEVHGHVHDALGEAMTQMAEEEAWKIEREQAEIKAELDVLARKVCLWVFQRCDYIPLEVFFCSSFSIDQATSGQVFDRLRGSLFHFSHAHTHAHTHTHPSNHFHPARRLLGGSDRGRGQGRLDNHRLQSRARPAEPRPCLPHFRRGRQVPHGRGARGAAHHAGCHRVRGGRG